MTDTVDETVAADEPKAPAGHYYVTMKDRRILVKSINTAQSMILGGMFRQLQGDSGVDDYLGMFGKLMRLVESLLPQAADMAWLEERILAGELDVGDFAMIFLPVAEEGAAKKRPQPKRGRG